MKLIIDISEEEYIKICDEPCTHLAWVIANGTPLPKGHGRLIDYSWVVDNVIKKFGIKDERYLLEAEKALMSIVEIAPTIIEADNAEREEEKNERVHKN